MSIVLLSPLPGTPGRVIAEGVASNLGYECISEPIFQQAASASGIPVDRIRKALQEPPGLLGMRLVTRRKCLAQFQAALSERLLRGQAVFDGPFGHEMIRGVAHALKVRITAALPDRIANLAASGQADRGPIEKDLKRQDQGRRDLAQLLFGSDDDDATRFDILINTSQLDPDNAIDIITQTAQLRRYQPMTYSIRCLQDLALAHKIEAVLLQLDPQVKVVADGGQVRIRTQLRGSLAKRRMAEIERKALAIEGVKAVQMQNVEDLFNSIAGRLR